MPRQAQVQQFADSARERNMLDQLQELLRDSSPLDADDKQLLMYLLWLLQPAESVKRQKALSRLAQPIKRKGLDRGEFKRRLTDTILEFEPVET